ncbi:MAG: hypothetical protein B7C24_14910 [Bacteroidetes bacterium 4572_77]|nr:MAG: hypothetical protein B7C24_14910 [Bacteroidetes bacterium 4572_77]
MKIKLSILFLLSSLFVFANTGTIKGIIKDKDNKEHLMGVSIAIYNKEKTEMITGTITDMDGNYEIDLEPGDYHFEISYVSYKNEDLRIAIKPEETIIKNIELMETSFDLESVEIIARVSRESENLLLLDQKEATSIEEKIGAKELSRKGSSNVAAGVKKIAGVSMMGSKQLFVRGLGDRYNSVELNGLPLVSPDPTKKIIKLDMFSSNIIEYLNVQKAYSANHFADYTGALININTLDYPEEALLKFSMGSSFNNQSTGKDFTRINAEGLRYFSFDVKKRQELTPQKYWVAKKRTQEIDADFNYASYGFSKNKAMPTSDFSLTGGKLFKLKNQRKLGFLIHLSHKNKYEYKPNVIQKQINKQNIIDADFISQKYSYNSVFTSFLNLAFIPNKNNSLKYNILFLNNGEDGFNEKVGTRPDWQNGEKIATIRNAQYINYRLFVQQLKGEHQLSKPLSLHWALGLTDVKYDVPDRREIVYINPTSENKNEWVYMTLNNGNDSKRVIVNQLNKELNFNIFFKYELGKKETKGSIKVGAAGKSTTTNYHSYYYGYLFETQEGNLTLPVDIQNPDEYFTPEYLKKVRNNSSDAMGYIGESYIWAGFADFNYHFGEKITLNAGLRTEISQMSVTADMNVDDGDEKASIRKITCLYYS